MIQLATTWQELKSYPLDDQIKEINKAMQEGNTMTDIMKYLGVDRSTGSKYYKGRGYILTDGQLKHMEEKQISPIDLYQDLHNMLIKLDMGDYVRTSISFSKDTEKHLKDFLKAYPLVNKQDFITYAIEQAIAKYNKG